MPGRKAKPRDAAASDRLPRARRDRFCWRIRSFWLWPSWRSCSTDPGSRGRAGARAAGIALPAGAYALPLDSLVTDLRVGRQSADLPLQEAPMDLSKGTFLVALLDVNAADSRETVKRLNLLNGEQTGAPVVAFCGGEVDEKTIFCFNTSPSFEVVAAPRADLKRLYRKLPRFFQLKEGRVS